MKISSEDLRQKLSAACIFQQSVSDAAIDIVLTAIYERTTIKYGERGIRYVHMEAGHVCQNILLTSVSLGLGAVPIGAFDDSSVQKLLNLPSHYMPLYVIPVGYPED
jgi:SagB-type dehydrogenase family enzyme